MPDGSTLRDTLLAAERAGADRDPLFNVALPRGVASLWVALCDVYPDTSSGGSVYAALEAWSRIHGVTLNPWEVDSVVAAARALGAAARK